MVRGCPTNFGRTSSCHPNQRKLFGRQVCRRGVDCLSLEEVSLTDRCTGSPALVVKSLRRTSNGFPIAADQLDKPSARSQVQLRRDRTLVPRLPLAGLADIPALFCAAIRLVCHACPPSAAQSGRFLRRGQSPAVVGSRFAVFGVGLCVFVANLTQTACACERP